MASNTKKTENRRELRDAKLLKKRQKRTAKGPNKRTQIKLAS